MTQNNKSPSTTTAEKQKNVEIPEENPYKDFEKDMLQLVLEEPFLTSISMHILKQFDYSMPTAYVGIKDMSVEPGQSSYRLTMGVNPVFMSQFPSMKRIGVFMHELYHVAMKHLTDRNCFNKDYARIHNMASDLAINSLITAAKLPNICLIPGQIPYTFEGKPVEGPIADLIKNLQKNQTTEYYFDKLKEFYEEQQKKDKDGDPFGGLGSMDNHDWDMPSEVQEEFDNQIRNILEEAVKEADRSNKWGNVPFNIREQIRKSLVKEVDWRSIIRAFIGRVRSQERESTIKKINKKFPYIFPGVKRKFISNFACFIDQSGSVSDEDVALLFSELENLAKEVELDVYNFDTEVDVNSHFKWKRKERFKSWARTRCGGTDFNCVSGFCNDPKTPKWDGIIILTDGYAPVMNMIKGSKVMWVITPGGTLEYVRKGDLVVQMKNENKEKKFTKNT